MDSALGAKFLNGVRYKHTGFKNHRKQVVVDFRRPSCVKFRMAAFVNVRAHSFPHNEGKQHLFII